MTNKEMQYLSLSIDFIYLLEMEKVITYVDSESLLVWSKLSFLNK